MRDGRLTPPTLMEACLARIADREPTVRAFAWFEPARRALRPRTAPPGPLHGLPVGVKDVLDTADMPSEYRLADLAGLAAARGCRRGGLGAGGRRGGDGQDRHHGVAVKPPGR